MDITTGDADMTDATSSKNVAQPRGTHPDPQSRQSIVVIVAVTAIPVNCFPPQ
jgi:hypothetical protein